MSKLLPDIQNTKPKYKIPINQVGVENVEVPFLLQLASGGYRQIVANVSMRTNLNDQMKGISMSRLLLTLKPYLEVPLKRVLILEILKDIRKNVHSDNAYMRFDFKLPINRESPNSKNIFPIYYQCRFEGQLEMRADNDNYFRFFQGVRVQYASYCPCSAGLCGDLQTKGSSGFPHAQRSFADVLVEVIDPHYVWLETVIALAEAGLSTLPYPIIKRVDEQEIARIAAQNPMFVEDAIRAISYNLNKSDFIHDWIVKCTHEESIHTSEAIAINWKGVENGFDGTYYL